MRSPVDHARDLLGAWASARAAAALARARGADLDDPDRLAEARARRALGSGQVREAIEQAAPLLTPHELGAMLAMQALAARDEVLARAGVHDEPRADVALPLAGALRPVSEAALEALHEPDRERRQAALAALAAHIDGDRSRRAEAIEQACAIQQRIRRRGPPAADDDPEDLATRAERLLQATDDAAAEALARLVHVARAARPRTAPEALAVLRAHALDPLAPARDRGRRIARTLAPIGLEAPLASRARLASPHPFLDGPRLVPVDPPRRLTVVPGPLELGLASELALARVLGAASAMLGVAPALPIELRAFPGSTACALGEVLAWLHADATFLRRMRGLDGSALEAFRTGAAAQMLARVRVLAAWALASGRSDRERQQRGAELVARALAVPEPEMPAFLADPLPLEHEGPRLRAALAAPALCAALRERHDEDWFRNPRARETLQAAMGRGLGLSVESWAAELGAALDAAPCGWSELAVR